MAQIDWLSINYEGIYNDSKLFTEKHLDFGSKYFKNITELYHMGELLCTLAYNPKSSILSSKLIQVKFANKYLYYPGLMDLAEMLSASQNWIFKGFSRIDICYDFNTFHNNLHPEQFIKRFLNGRYIKKGKQNFTVFGKNNNKLKFEYLRFGSSNSIVQCYLYNKTTELMEKKNKPYIRELWEEMNLNTDSDVWRLEFSIKGDAWKCLKTDSGELVKHTLSILRDYIFINRLYASLVYQYFYFFKYTGQKIKSREEHLQLLFDSGEIYKLLQFSETADSTKTDKIMISQMLKVYDELRESKKVQADLFYTMAKREAQRKDLFKFFVRKEELLNIN